MYQHVKPINVGHRKKHKLGDANKRIFKACRWSMQLMR